MRSVLPDPQASPFRHRVRALNAHPVRPGAYVLYWMTAYRRRRYNLALQWAVAWAEAMELPLVVFEALRAGHHWASARTQAFIMAGMEDQKGEFADSPAHYLSYVERRPGEGQGLLQAVAAGAALVVGDDSPAYFIPRMLRAASRALPCRLEAVDGDSIRPLRASDRLFHRAHDYRRALQRDTDWGAWPKEDPLAGVSLPRLGLVPDLRAWNSASNLAEVEVDRAVEPGAARGGPVAARARWRAFLDAGLDRYEEDRNHPDFQATSGVAPYLHFGHLGVHEVLAGLIAREGWTPERVRPPGDGRRAGYWGMSASAEAFVDQVWTWRELAYHTAAHLPDYDRYETLPAWARETLASHAADPRVRIYSKEQLERAQTADPLWNAAQRQLVRSGAMHNYLRMLWGKQILAWSPSPEVAFETMLALNDRYALDGRDPNSVAGVAWVMGRYDRAWGPERPVFGKIRYMTSENTARKLKVKKYLERWGPHDTP